jgi:hypothetical protein
LRGKPDGLREVWVGHGRSGSGVGWEGAVVEEEAVLEEEKAELEEGQGWGKRFGRIQP